MITYRLQIAVLGREQSLTIVADNHRRNDDDQVEFLDGERVVATVPAAIIIDIAEA